MKGNFVVIAISLVLELTVHLVGAAEVNISLTTFQGGVLVVPENQLEGEFKVDLTEAVSGTAATVMCYSLEFGPGVSTVEFSNSSASVGTTDVNVTFRVVSPGRPVTIQCSAQSQGSNPQFNIAGSRGNKASLRVTKAPTVVICPSLILLHKYQPKSSVQVQFSEKIRGFPVLVNCSTLAPEHDGPPVLQLHFTETYVQIDQTTAKVPYEITSRGAPVLVTCQARSVNMSQPIVSSSVRVSATQLTSSLNNTVSMATTASVQTTVSGTSSSLSSSAVVSSVGGGGSGGSPGPRAPSGVASQYWYNNSAGPPVTFALDISPLRILPPAGFIRAPNGIFRAVLTLDQPAENTVDVTCSLDAVSRGSDFLNTPALCSSPPADTVTFANSSVELKLSIKDIQFQKDELFKNIDLTLSGTPAWRAEGLVRVTCCGQDTGLSLRYNNESAVVFAWVELRRLQPVDWDKISSDQRTTTLESDIDMTCPCNLKENSCDVGCCCDQDCSDYEDSACIPGFFGGATSERPFEYSCQATWPDAADWQPFLCVTINNSPVIGYFYNFSSPPTAQDTPAFNALEEKKARQAFSFSESEEQRASFEGGLYRAGTTIKTAANTDEPSYARAELGVLSLPQTVFSGLCSQTAPVRFLEEFVSSCVHELEESLCSSSSPVSALNYLMPIKLNQPACPLPPAVLAEGRLNDTLGDAPELAATEVRYYCADISRYISATTEGSPDLVNTSSLFEKRCVFDDGQTRPPVPEFSTSTRVCSNVVVKVEYFFLWRGNQIIDVLAKVTLGNVKIPTNQRNSGLATSQAPIHTLSQSFSVSFLHSRLDSSNTSQITDQRSGNPGYVRGLPILGRLETNSTPASAGKLLLWSPAADSLCAGFPLTPVLYGQDATSGCLLRLSLEDLRNCSRLKQIVQTNQEILIQATHVGRRGNAVLAVAGDWLPIVREPFNTSTDPSLDDGVCPGMPSGLLIEMLVSEAGKYGGVPQMEVVGTRISFQYTTWKFNCVSGSGVSCSPQASNGTDTNVTQVLPSPSVTPTPSNSLASQNVTGSSVNQSVAISSSTLSMANSSATSSMVNSSATSSMLNSSVSVSLPDANNQSSGGETDTKTKKYGPRFQYFLLSSSVVFIKVPSEKPSRVKRSLDETGICYNDVCKEELFFPLTEAYTGEPREKALALSLFLIFLALVIFAVTKPWG